MLKSEKHSLVRFLMIYLLSTFILFSIASWMFYISSKHQILDRQRETLKFEAERIQSKLRELHHSNAVKLVYPNIPGIDTAIFDLDKKYIFGTFDTVPSLEKQKSRKMIYYEVHVEPYFLGAAYLLLAKKIELEPIHKLQFGIAVFMIIAGLVFTFLGYYLGRLFVAPMRDSLKRMNRFIEDTTHELNTPISTILTNIEMIETFGKHDESVKELKRIEIASKTLSRIYDDLTYLNLNHKHHRIVVTVNISQLVEERMVYFSAMAESKQLKIIKQIEENVKLQMDKNDALRLVDNLLSNAIKYNKKGGLLTVIITSGSFVVKDTGIGIKKEDIFMIMERFKRANSSEGGFGVGLDIVNQVVKTYDFKLKINSKYQEGTEVFLTWSK